MDRHPTGLILTHHSTRRNFLGAGLAVTVTGLLAACGAPAPTSNPGAAPTVAASAASGAATVAPAAAKPTQSTGELKLAIDGEFPATLDGTKNAYQLVRLGLAETLTRLTPQMKLVPWLAKDVSNVDATTWRVMLRPNAR